MISRLKNGGNTFFKEFGIKDKKRQFEIIESPDTRFEDTTVENIYEIAEWVFINSKLFYIDDKGWLHVHAGIPRGLKIKAMYTEQAAFEKLQHEFRENGKLNLSEFKRIFEDMSGIFWIRRWAYQLIEVSGCEFVSGDAEISQKMTLQKNKIIEEMEFLGISNDDFEASVKHQLLDILTRTNVAFTVKAKDKLSAQTLNGWLDSFQIQGIMFGHDHHRVLLNVEDVILGADIDNSAYIIVNHEAIFLHKIGEPKKLIIPFDKLIYKVDRQIYYNYKDCL